MVGIIIRKCKIKQNTGKMHEMLENASVQSSISFGVVSDRLRRWYESPGPITEWSKAISKRWGITFDTQLNLSLKVRWPCWVVALSYLPWLLVTMLGSCFEFSSLTFGLFCIAILPTARRSIKSSMRLYNSSTVFALETALFITVKLSTDILFFMIITQESFLLCLVFMVNRMGSLTCKLNSSCFVFFFFC